MKNGELGMENEKVTCSVCSKHREPEYADRCVICGKPVCVACSMEKQAGHIIEIGFCLFDPAAVLRLFVCNSIECSAEFAGRYPDLLALIERYENLRGRIDNWINEFDPDNDGLTLTAQIRTRRAVGMTFAETLLDVYRDLAACVVKYPKLFGETSDVNQAVEDGRVDAEVDKAGNTGESQGEAGGDPRIAAQGVGAGGAAAELAARSGDVLEGVRVGAESPEPAAGGDPPDRLGV